MTIFYFIIALGILVFIHEFGHFIVAKKSGVFVEEFSIGFGPKLFAKKWGETEYKLCLLPLGGYVKLHGENPEDEESVDKARAFSEKKLSTKAAVVIAGPVMNFLLCLFLMPIVFMLGRTVPAFFDAAPVVEQIRADSPAASVGLTKGDLITQIDGSKVSNWEEAINQIIVATGQKVNLTVDHKGETKEFTVPITNSPEGGYAGFEPNLFLGIAAIIGKVNANGPAAKAGIEVGDQILSLNGENIDDWIDLTEAIAKSKGEKVSLKLQRNNSIVNTEIQADYNEDLKRYLVGIEKQVQDIPSTVRKYGFLASLQKGGEEVVQLTSTTFNVFWRLISMQLSLKVLGGPIMIAQTTAAAAKLGLGHFLYFLAFMSLQLGIINLFPIPVLDGGHLFFYGIEAVIRRPVSRKIRMVMSQLGFAMLIALMLAVTFNDVQRVWGNVGSLLGRFF